MAAFRGMHVSPAKHSYAWLSRKCNYRTDRHTHTQTDAGQSDPYVPLCFAGDTKTDCSSLMKKHTTPDKSVIPMWGEVWLSDRQTHPDTDRRRTKWSLCDLWPSKSIGFILSPWLTCLPSLIKKSTTVKSLLCSQAYFHRCPLWPWPLTSDLQN